MSRSRCPYQIRSLNVRVNTLSRTNFDTSPSPPALDVINNFVTLATFASKLIAPPFAVLGLTYFCAMAINDCSGQRVRAFCSFIPYIILILWAEPHSNDS